MRESYRNVLENIVNRIKQEKTVKEIVKKREKIS